MLKHTIALILISLMILSGVVWHHYLQLNQESQSIELESITPIGSRAWYENVVVKINYTVIEDPETLSTARKFIKVQLPLLASLNRGEEQIIDWLKTNITVLKVTLELTNNGDKPIYYVTNAFCEVLSNTTTRDGMFKPVTWSVKNPIAVPKIVAEEGHVFPPAISYTLDLRYRKVPPKISTTNEFYYIITKPFKGIIKAMAIICPEPFSNECKIIENHTHVYVVNVEYSPRTGKNIVNTFFSNKAFVLNLSAFHYNINVVMSNNMSISVDRNGLLTIYLENRGDRVYEDFSWVL